MEHCDNICLIKLSTRALQGKSQFLLFPGPGIARVANDCALLCKWYLAGIPLSTVAQ